MKTTTALLMTSVLNKCALNGTSNDAGPAANNVVDEQSDQSSEKQGLHSRNFFENIWENTNQTFHSTYYFTIYQ